MYIDLFLSLKTARSPDPGIFFRKKSSLTRLFVQNNVSLPEYFRLIFSHKISVLILLPYMSNFNSLSQKLIRKVIKIPKKALQNFSRCDRRKTSRRIFYETSLTFKESSLENRKILAYISENKSGKLRMNSRNKRMGGIQMTWKEDIP